jgi:hypothetical protein
MVHGFTGSRQNSSNPFILYLVDRSRMVYIFGSVGLLGHHPVIQEADDVTELKFREKIMQQLEQE